MDAITNFLFKSENGSLLLAGLFVLAVFVLLYKLVGGKKHGGAAHKSGAAHGQGGDHHGPGLISSGVKFAIIWSVTGFVLVLIQQIWREGEKVAYSIDYIWERWIFCPAGWVFFLILWRLSRAKDTKFDEVIFVVLFPLAILTLSYQVSGYEMWPGLWELVANSNPVGEFLFPSEYRWRGEPCCMP